MNSKPLFLSALVAACGFAVADTKSEIQKRYDSMGKAHVKRDAIAVMSFLTKDYVDIDHGKKSTRAEYEKARKAEFKNPSNLDSFVLKITKVTMKGAQAVVDLTGKATSTLKSGQKKSTIVYWLAARDVWVNEKGVWMCKSSETLSSKVTVDGKDPQIKRT